MLLLDLPVCKASLGRSYPGGESGPFGYGLVHGLLLVFVARLHDATEEAGPQQVMTTRLILGPKSLGRLLFSPSPHEMWA